MSGGVRCVIIGIGREWLTLTRQGNLRTYYVQTLGNPDPIGVFRSIPLDNHFFGPSFCLFVSIFIWTGRTLVDVYTQIERITSLLNFFSRS